MSHRTHVLEYSSPKVLDGVIKGVKIIGVESKNGYTYSLEALRDAVPLYEEAPVFILHPNSLEKSVGSRKLYDHFGSLRAIRERQNGKGLYADLHVKLSHPMADSVLDAVRRGEAKFGLSHNATCDFNEHGTEVVKISAVNSVDLVDEPATTNNLFEGEETMSEKQLKEMADNIIEQVSSKVLEEVAKRWGVPREIIQGDPEPNPQPKPKEKPTRLSALEAVKDDETHGVAPNPIGNTHDDFLAEMRGFATTN